MSLIAHAGHWITTVAYFLPVIAFIVWLAVTLLRQRRRSRRTRGADASDG